MLIDPQNSILGVDLEARLHGIRARVSGAALAVGRSAESVTLVAVSKGRTEAAVRALAAMGVRHFGENYLQEALPKMAALADLPLCWHFIGRIQTNKTRQVAAHFSWVHSIDRPRIAARLSEQRSAHLPPLNICVQVNIAGDGAKAGVDVADCAALVAAVQPLARVKLRGLMCMLPEDLQPPGPVRHFAELHALQEQLNRNGAALDSLSMGMSGDFEAAIMAGATLVRIGTALFGPRATAAAAQNA
jgi:PLP dependent protein